jgi:hypothetical protein
VVAASFCTTHGLPPDYRDQILAHVRPKIDLNLVALRKERERQEKLARSFKQVPCWSVGGFELCGGAVNLSAMKQRFLQFNAELTAAAAAAADAGAGAGAGTAAAAPLTPLTPSELKALDAVFQTLASELSSHATNSFGADQTALISRLLSGWGAAAHTQPSASAALIAVLDMVRAVMMQTAACDALGRSQPPSLPPSVCPAAVCLSACACVCY